MRRGIWLSLSVVLLSVVLFSCSSSLDGEAVKVNVSKSKPNILNMLGLKINDEQYAGLYIDDKGTFHINIVGEIDDFKGKAKLDNVEFHSVNYSLKYLNNVANVLTENMTDLGISAVEPNEKDNKVYIYIKDLDDNKLKEINKVIDSPAIEAKEHQEVIIKFN